MKQTMPITDPVLHPDETGLMPQGRGLFAGALAPLVLAFRPNWEARSVVLRLVGVLLVMAACGLWFFEAPVSANGLPVLRVASTVVFFFLGMVLLTFRNPWAAPEACFDPVRRELRVLRCDADGQRRTVLRRSYDSLAEVRLTQGGVQLFEKDGSLLMDLPLQNKEVRAQLMQQLGGKLRKAE